MHTVCKALSLSLLWIYKKKIASVHTVTAYTADFRIFPMDHLDPPSSAFLACKLVLANVPVHPHTDCTLCCTVRTTSRCNVTVCHVTGLLHCHIFSVLGKATSRLSRWLTAVVLRGSCTEQSPSDLELQMLKKKKEEVTCHFNTSIVASFRRHKGLDCKPSTWWVSKAQSQNRLITKRHLWIQTRPDPTL